jgi:type I restriction enzyme M protein
MIDASKGFIKDGNKNRLREQDIHKIVDVFNRQLKTPKYSRLVPILEIADPKNDYNLNIPRYIDSQEEEEDLQDIEAHLKGGIPNKDIDDLSHFWKVCPTLKNGLFVPSEREGYSILKVKHQQIRSTIFENPDFVAYKVNVNAAFEDWKNKILPLLENHSIGSKPKQLIIDLSESILSAFSQLDLIDNYDIYQKFMTYWTETMQDDAYQVAANGWKVEINIIKTINKKTKQEKEIGWICDLIPKNLVINRYFVKEQQTIDRLTEDKEKIDLQIQTIEEENSGEDDLLAEVKNDAGNVAKTDITKRLTEIGGNREFVEETNLLKDLLSLLVQESELNSTIRATELDLDKKQLNKFTNLSEKEVKLLVVEDKWLNFVNGSVKTVIEEISREVVGRIKELAERYGQPLQNIETEVKSHCLAVNNHLKKMGFE